MSDYPGLPDYPQEKNTVQRKTVVSEFGEDRLQAGQGAVTLDLTFRP